MNELDALIALIPEDKRPSLGTVIGVVMVLGRIFKSLREGNGLVGAYRSLLYGTAVPKALENRVTNLEANSEITSKP